MREVVAREEVQAFAVVRLLGRLDRRKEVAEERRLVRADEDQRHLSAVRDELLLVQLRGEIPQKPLDLVPGVERLPQDLAEDLEVRLLELRRRRCGETEDILGREAVLLDVHLPLLRDIAGARRRTALERLQELVVTGLLVALGQPAEVALDRRPVAQRHAALERLHLRFDRLGFGRLERGLFRLLLVGFGLLLRRLGIGRCRGRLGRSRRVRGFRFGLLRLLLLFFLLGFFLFGFGRLRRCRPGREDRGRPAVVFKLLELLEARGRLAARRLGARGRSLDFVLEHRPVPGVHDDDGVRAGLGDDLCANAPGGEDDDRREKDRRAHSQDPDPSGGGPEPAPRASFCPCALLLLLPMPRPRPDPQPFHCEGRGSPCRSARSMRARRIADSRSSRVAAASLGSPALSAFSAMSL